MFETPRRALTPVHRHPRPHEESAGGPGPGEADDARRPVPGDAADAATVGLWEASGEQEALELAPDTTADIGADRGTHSDDDLPTGETELDIGRAALGANDIQEAAVRLGLVLRVAPGLAPAVLDLIHGRPERALALVRGDAYRLVGRELDARRAFAEAARGGAWLAPPSDDPSAHPSEGDPA
jgi:hypothetical protein